MDQSNGDDGRIQFDPESFDEPSTAIVRRIATATDRDPTDMPPLYDYVDVEALDTLITTSTTRTDNPVRLSFSYDGIEVTVDSHDGITLTSDGTDLE